MSRQPAQRTETDVITDFIPLAAPSIGDAEVAAVARVLQSGMLAQGPEVNAFEAEFAEAHGASEAVAVNSGTSALFLVLKALGIGSGDEVIVPSFTFAATANVVALAGATPVFVDIDPATYCIDPAAVDAAISQRTVGMIPVHLYGHPADVGALTAIAGRNGLFMLEDAAQAHLATYEGQAVGTFGTAAAFSFYPTKNMTSGEGGMVTTADSALARTIRLLRNQGMERRYENEIAGFNMRMTDIHASIGRVQLRSLPAWNEARRRNAAFLDAGFARLGGVETPFVAPGVTHVYHQYTLRIDRGRRDQLANDLGDRGIGCGVYYPTPVHSLAAFGLDVDLPETDRAASEVVSLPVHPDLGPGDLERIVGEVSASLGRTE
jgi:dTDP-4-amino-4,6-dideoxygalactose transaminase